MIVKARGYTTDKEQLKTGMGSFIKVDAEREFRKRDTVKDRQEKN